jgi:hypothetical protein
MLVAFAVAVVVHFRLPACETLVAATGRGDDGAC